MKKTCLAALTVLALPAHTAWRQTGRLLRGLTQRPGESGGAARRYCFGHATVRPSSLAAIKGQ